MSTETRRLNYEDFEFNKLSYNEKQGLLTVEYNERGGSKDGHTHKSLETPHPDLLTSLDALRPHLARVLGLQQGWDFARENVKDAKTFDALKQATQGAKDADNSVKVVSITLMGDGETAGVKIGGFMKCLNGDMKVNCPVVRFRSEAMAIEQTVEKLVEQIKEEAFGFIFQSKRKQYSLEEQEEINNRKNKKNRKDKNQLNLVDEAEKAEEQETDKVVEPATDLN